MNYYLYLQKKETQKMTKKQYEKQQNNKPTESQQNKQKDLPNQTIAQFKKMQSSRN